MPRPQASRPIICPVSCPSDIPLCSIAVLQAASRTALSSFAQCGIIMQRAGLSPILTPHCSRSRVTLPVRTILYCTVLYTRPMHSGSRSRPSKSEQRIRYCTLSATSCEETQQAEELERLATDTRFSAWTGIQIPLIVTLARSFCRLVTECEGPHVFGLASPCAWGMDESA